MESEIKRIESEHAAALAALQRRTDLRLSLESGGAQSDAAKLAMIAAAAEKRRIRHARQASDEAIERERIETTYRARVKQAEADSETELRRRLADFDRRNPGAVPK